MREAIARVRTLLFGAAFGTALLFGARTATAATRAPECDDPVANTWCYTTSYCQGWCQARGVPHGRCEENNCCYCSWA
jgi:hypothetical protein